MALTEEKSFDLIEVVENGIVQVREKTAILRDGTEVSATYHRWTIAPGDDFSSHPSERVRALCKAVHTPECIANFQQYLSTIVEVPKQEPLPKE